MKLNLLFPSLIIGLFGLFISLNINAASGAPCGNYLSENGLVKGECDEAYVDANDKASLQRLSLIHISEPTRPY